MLTQTKVGVSVYALLNACLAEFLRVPNVTQLTQPFLLVLRDLSASCNAL